MSLLGNSDDNTTRPSISIAIISDLNVAEDLQKHLIYAYKLLGYKVEFYPMFPGRALKLTNKGELDAEAIRIPIIERKAPNLIRIPVSLVKGHLELYCAYKVPCDESILNNENNIIGVVSGTNITTTYMKTKGASAYNIASNLVLAQLLERNRLDYILSLSTKGSKNIVDIDRSKYQVIQLYEFDSYHYIHKKHINIISNLTSALQKAQDELGFIEAN